MARADLAGLAGKAFVVYDGNELRACRGDRHGGQGETSNAAVRRPLESSIAVLRREVAPHVYRVPFSKRDGDGGIYPLCFECIIS